MRGSTNIEMLRGALHEAEDELRALGDMLVNEEWGPQERTWAAANRH